MAYIGDGNNVVHSLMIASAKIGIDFSIACPDGYEPNKEIVEFAKKEAQTVRDCDYRRCNRSSERC